MANIKDNSGALFTAKDKRGPNSPDYSGNATVSGKDYWVSAWVKTDRNGNKYLSMAYTAKDQQQQASRNADSRPSYAQDDSDDIPF